jgi:GMP synthase-like glutamine amidotransferase
MSKIKKNIIIVGNSNNDYLTWLGKLKNFNIKVINNLKDFNKLLDKGEFIDLAVFTGGSDVNPDYYGQNIGKFTHIDKERDAFEVSIWERLPKSVVKVAICRGAQFATAMSGGSLVQHVNGHGGEHTISTKEGLILNMTSTHHQMMYPNELSKDAYDLIAWSTYFKSDTYLNGRNEEMEIPREFLEPEIVYYKNTNALAIQGHPEFSSCDTETSNYCLDLVRNLLSK